MTMPAAVIKPFVQVQPGALCLWMLANLASLGFELHQWRQRREEAKKNDRGSYRILMTCAGIGLGALVVAPAFAPGAVIRPTPLAFAAGIAIYLAGFAMRRWSEMTLGRYFTFTVMTSTEQPVITSGPYRFVRHPGYTGVMLVVVGAGLVTGNWVGLAAWTFLVMSALLYRIHVEEAALISAVGDRYRAYASGHKRLIPLVW